ncbi:MULTISPECIES: response regulator [unclassified Tolypothrix]|uniref:response regulator n=1 Tax=unclassified Tolypothrix TaxID=2649714 RepID=UPI0005EAC11D|nr:MULTISPECIES: response regulator [unclassified Tolypothrix]BAY90342.1 response regulator receiver protein [Microchaete diplosiphon NIES-3275]EKE98804.1 response regulator [Tolypothrix sp. PCC 7601]MBE9083390.1 response regulator [Tolypothrix sp. LEGE 11397]UYD24520.1 response regulator [Tolypothrix sp. PCC 7712]UYD33250.1 response regulator [Tolypothrix sp. PCC 7601]
MTKRVLIVDDEPDIRRIIQVSLEEMAGWKVSTAQSGSDALLTVKTGHWDAILLDISMPDMSGFDVCQKLQSDPATQLIPIVLLTAKVQPSDRRRFAQMGVAGVIAKPFNPVTISNEVAQTLGWELF